MSSSVVLLKTHRGEKANALAHGSKLRDLSMPPRRNKEKFQQLTEFERGLREGGFFLSRNRRSCAEEQFHSDASLEAMDRRAPNNSKECSG
ncbi:hypothetical protein TNCV_3783701 [Trichonephila clavipes]|nr:hypothetical protein TNCV_3783701 [Trichonephila clavipes]